MLLRRSARNAKASSTTDTTITPSLVLKHSVRSKKSQIAGGGSGSKTVSALPLKGKTRNTKDRGGGRVPLSSVQTTETVEKPQHNNHVVVELVSPVKRIAEKKPLLKEFMEDLDDVNLDVSYHDEIDHEAAAVVVERVESWQANRPSPQQALSATSHRLPFSSSLPPSSPLPPLPQDPPSSSLGIFEFNPPSLQQEDNLVVDADVSYEANLSDDFGFFAAQSRIHAKMDRERNMNDGTRRRSAVAADTTLEISFSGRPAFATPHVRRRKTFTAGQQDVEEAGEEEMTASKRVRPKAGNDEISSPEPPRVRRGRARAGARSDKKGGGRNGKSKKPRVAPARGKVPSNKKPLQKVSDRASRKASGSSATARQPKAKQKVQVAVDIEESDIECADSEEEGGSGEASDQAKKQRIAEFEALEDYELEVEDVIVF